MKVICILITLFFTNTTIIPIEDIRDSYKICNQSEENAERFYELTKKALNNEGAIYKGYHGAALALKASFAWNPFKKLSHFNKAKKMIDEAIVLEPTNIELRMIRLSIQSNAPKIAGYYKNIKEDKSVIINTIDTVVDKELQEYVQGFMDHSNSLETK